MRSGLSVSPSSAVGKIDGLIFNELRILTPFFSTNPKPWWDFSPASCFATNLLLELAEAPGFDPFDRRWPNPQADARHFPKLSPQKVCPLPARTRVRGAD